MLQKYAIIVAGGAGLRMGGDIPKQFLPLDGTPILVHTIRRFLEISGLKVVLVLPEIHMLQWDNLEKTYFSDIKSIEVAVGGNTRFQSVRNGLNLIPKEKSLIAVHDAVRPFVSVETIMAAFEMAQEKGNAVLAVASKDSIRMKNGENNTAIPRQNIFLIQTPQIFSSEILHNAYLQSENIHFTDDASVVEKAGQTIWLVEGSYNNIKITSPEDYDLAQILINKLT